MFKKAAFILACVSMFAAATVPLMAAGGGFDPNGGAGGAMGGMGGGGMGGMTGGGGFGGPGGGGGGGWNTGNYNPYTQTLYTIQYELNYPDGNEWLVVSARIQKVLEDLQKLAAIPNPLQTSYSNFGGGGRTSRTGTSIDTTNPIAVARYDIQQMTVEEKIDEAAVKAKLKEIREARRRTEEELHVDREALRRLLLIRQESMLMDMGILD